MLISIKYLYVVLLGCGGRDWGELLVGGQGVQAGGGQLRRLLQTSRQFLCFILVLVSFIALFLTRLGGGPPPPPRDLKRGHEKNEKN